MPGIAKLQRLDNRAVAYLAFFGFCILSAGRDVVSEALFKNTEYDASPVFVLFVYSVMTQLVAGLVLLASRPDQRARRLEYSAELFWLNGFTLAAFLFYFLAIYSPLGAAANSFVDYGSSPAFTAIIGLLILGEGLDPIFALSALLSVAGIFILALPRITINEFGLIWAAGLAFSLLSSLFSALYRVYFKRFLAGGASKSAIIFFRLFGLTFTLGAMLAVKPEQFRVDLLIKTCTIGLVGFTLPLFLSLTMIQNLTIRSFAMLLFALPAITFFMSASFGYAKLFYSDILAGALTAMGVFIHERRAPGKAAS